MLDTDVSSSRISVASMKYFQLLVMVLDVSQLKHLHGSIGTEN